MRTTICIKWTGTPMVWVDRHPVRFTYRREEAVFYYLARCHGGTREKLAQLIWPQHDIEHGRSCLRHALHCLRNDLGCELTLSQGKTGLAVHPDITWTEWTDEPNGTFLEYFYLDDCTEYEGWIQQERACYSKQHRGVLFRQAESSIQGHRIREAENLLIRMLAADSTDEAVAVRLMRLYEQEQAYSHAVNLYVQLRNDLKEELGTEPLKETSQLYYQILNKWNESTIDSIRPNAHSIIAREWVINKMLQACMVDGTSFDKRRYLIIKGAVGMGRTYLFQYFSKRRELESCLVLKVSCFLSQQDNPAQIWQQILVQLAVAGEIPQGREILMNQTAGSLSQQLCLTLAGVSERQPVVLMIDDLQWADDNSITHLLELMRTLNNQRVTMLISCRIPCRDSIRKILEIGEMDQLFEQICLNPFSFHETKAFLRDRMGDRLTDAQITQAYRISQGTPLLMTRLWGSYPAATGAASDSATDELFSRLSLGLTRSAWEILAFLSIRMEGLSAQMLSGLINLNELETQCLCKELEQRSLVSKEDGCLILGQRAFRTLILKKMVDTLQDPPNQKLFG